jgi:hypothetical protein
MDYIFGIFGLGICRAASLIAILRLIVDIIQQKRQRERANRYSATPLRSFEQQREHLRQLNTVDLERVGFTFVAGYLSQRMIDADQDYLAFCALLGVSRESSARGKQTNIEWENTLRSPDGAAALASHGGLETPSSSLSSTLVSAGLYVWGLLILLVVIVGIPELWSRSTRPKVRSFASDNEEGDAALGALDQEMFEWTSLTQSAGEGGHNRRENEQTHHIVHAGNVAL